MSYSPREELFNVLTHGLGVLFGFVGLFYLCSLALEHESQLALFAACVFTVSLILLYSTSTLYHLITSVKHKPLLRLLDHISIYLLIAGTYTPFLLLGIGGRIGWWGFGTIWAVAFAGIIYKLFFRHRYPRLSLIIYLCMGWLVVLIIKPLTDALPLPVLLLIAAGGVCYTAGTYFYRQKMKIYYHAIWHLFVLGGSIFHYLAVAQLFM